MNPCIITITTSEVCTRHYYSQLEINLLKGKITIPVLLTASPSYNICLLLLFYQTFVEQQPWKQLLTRQMNDYPQEATFVHVALHGNNPSLSRIPFVS